MDWKSLLLHAWAVLREHWINSLISLAALFAGTWLGKRRARAEWSRKRFLDRLNFSFNTLHNGTLQIRTLAEKNCRDVFLNEIATERVLAAAKHTSADNPILPLPADDRWFMLNAVLNELSEQFATGFVKRDMGLPVQTAVYLICLTYENDGALMTRKIRAMIVRKEFLLNLPTEPPKLERPHHIRRFMTLQQMAAAYGADKTNFFEVELCI